MTTSSPTTRPATIGEPELARWLDAYGAAWEGRDSDAAVGLFTDDADYHWGPFDVLHGRAEIAQRWSAATSNQRDIHFEHAPLAIADELAFAHWRCTLKRLSTGMHCELDGILVLRFDEHGLCTQLREWWLAREERAS